MTLRILEKKHLAMFLAHLDKKIGETRLAFSRNPRPHCDEIRFRLLVSL